MKRRARLDQAIARRGLWGLSAAGLGIGSACLLAAGPVSRLAGLPTEPRALWSLRLFAVRELLLGLGLAQAARGGRSEQARLMAGLTAISQAGDLAVTGPMLAAGSVSRRVAAAVLLGAPPTLLAALAIRRAYR